jgi:hypothetical protein
MSNGDFPEFGIQEEGLAMNKYLLIVPVLLVWLTGLSVAHGQKAAEIYIPLGESPGMSYKYTVIGEVRDVDVVQRAVTVDTSTESYAVKIGNRTRLWLDRSPLKLTNLTGNISDLKKGRRIEVLFENQERMEPVKWIKIEITE